MSTQPIYAIKDKAPEFPCWLWGTVSRGWIRFQESEMHRNHEYGEPLWTHWHPDAPTAPTARPQQQAKCRDFVPSGFDDHLCERCGEHKVEHADRPQAEVPSGAYGVRIEQTPTGIVRHGVKQPEKPQKADYDVKIAADAHHDYPNISAISTGTISGRFSEWPRVKPEAIALLEEVNRWRTGRHAPTVSPPSREAELREALAKAANVLMCIADNPDNLVRTIASARRMEKELRAALSAPSSDGPSDAQLREVVFATLKEVEDLEEQATNTFYGPDAEPSARQRVLAELRGMLEHRLSAPSSEGPSDAQKAERLADTIARCLEYWKNELEVEGRKPPSRQDMALLCEVLLYGCRRAAMQSKEGRT